MSDSNGGYTLPDKSMRPPDVGWVSRERLMRVLPESLKKFAPVCPDFVTEVRSESTNLNELQAKMEKWLQNEVRLGWLVDPQTQRTGIYRPGQEPETKAFIETPSGEDVLVGFSMNVNEVSTYQCTLIPTKSEWLP